MNQLRGGGCISSSNKHQLNKKTSKTSNVQFQSDFKAMISKHVEIIKISQDCQDLRSKTIYELFDIRQMNIVQAQKAAETLSIYIKPLCAEKPYLKEGQFEAQKPNNLFNIAIEDNDGELNEFIFQKKSSMLIHGPAGSGKSTVCRKMEQELWKMYASQRQNGQILTVPIVVQLPQLQDPEFSAITETLLSDNYMFDLNQIRELKEEIKKDRVQLFIIMDSYDELKKEFIGKNLLITNKISVWGTIRDKYYPKIITTTRSEVLNQEHYEDWFLPEVENALPYYKEIRLEGFNKQQQNQYIEQYTILSLKLAISESYYHLTNTQSINYFQYLDMFHQLWNSLQINYNRDDQDALLPEQQIKQIEQNIFSRAEITTDNNQLKRELIVNLRELKSFHCFSYCIDRVNIEYLLDTPFMMEIVVQVLPSLIRSKSSQKVVRQIFENNYSSSKQSISMQDFDAIWKQLVQSQIFFDRYSIILPQKDIYQLFKECGLDPKYHDICIDLLQYQINQYDFYEIFFKTLFDKQLTKYKDQAQEFNYQGLIQQLWDFATKLAIDLSKENKTQIQYQQSGLLENKKIESWEDYYFDDDCKEGVYKKMFRSCIPIKHSAGNYSFNHKSLQEFLVAKDFMDRLTSLTGSNQDLQDKFLKHFVNQSDWSVDFLKGTCQFIVQQSQNLKKAQANLVKLIKLNQDHESSYIRLGSNCLFLILQIGPLLQGIDLRNIKIENTNLQGGNLAYCHLDNSIMKNVNISSVNLFKSSLKKVQWDNTKTEEYPRIPFKGKLIMTDNQGLILIPDDQQYLKFENKDETIQLFADKEEKYSYNIVNSNIYFYSSKQLIKINTNNGEKIVYEIQNVQYVQEFKNKIICFTVIEWFDNVFIQIDINTNQIRSYQKQSSRIDKFFVINEQIILCQQDRSFHITIFKEDLSHIQKYNLTPCHDAGYVSFSLNNHFLYDGIRFFTWKLVDQRIELCQIYIFPKVDLIIEDQRSDVIVGIDAVNLYLIDKSWKVKKSISHNLDYQIRSKYEYYKYGLFTFKQNYYLDNSVFIINVETHVNIYNVDQFQLLRAFDLPSGLIQDFFIHKRQFMIVQYKNYYYYNRFKSQTISNNNFQIQSILFLRNSLNFIVQQLPSLNLLYYNVDDLSKPILINEGIQNKCILKSNSNGDLFAQYERNFVSKEYQQIFIWNSQFKLTYSIEHMQDVNLTYKLQVYGIKQNYLYRINQQGQLSYEDINFGVTISQNQIIKYIASNFALVICYQNFYVVVDHHLDINQKRNRIEEVQALQEQLLYWDRRYYITQSQVVSTLSSREILYKFYIQVLKVVECDYCDSLVIVDYKNISILDPRYWNVIRKIQTNFIPELMSFNIMSGIIYANNRNKLFAYSCETGYLTYKVKLPFKPQQIVEYYDEQTAILINGQVYIYKGKEYKCILQNHRGVLIFFKDNLFASLDNDRLVYQASEFGKIIIHFHDFSQWMQPSISRFQLRDVCDTYYLYGILNNQIVMLELGSKTSETLDLNGKVEIEQVEFSDQFKIYLQLQRTMVLYQMQDKLDHIICNSLIHYVKISDDQKLLLISREDQLIDIYLTGKKFTYFVGLSINSNKYEDIVIFNETQLVFVEQHLIKEYLFKERTTEVIANLNKSYYSVGMTSKGFSVANGDGSIDMYTKMKYFDEVKQQQCENYVIFKTVNSSPAKRIQAYNTEIDGAKIITENGMDLKDLFKSVNLD